MYGLEVGDRIRLLAMPNDIDPVPTGTEGTITGFGGSPPYGQIWVDWDDGRNLMLLPDLDKWEKI